MKRLGLVMLLILWPMPFTLAADDAPPAQDTTHQIIQYKAPPGWTASDPPGGATKAYTSPDSNVAQQAYLVIALTQAQENFDFPAAFDRAIKATAPGATIMESSQPAPAKTRQGFDALSQTIAAKNAAGQMLFVRMVAAKVNDRMAAFAMLASTKELYEKHQPEMDALLKSVSFSVAAPAPAAAAGAAPAAAQDVDPRVKAAMERFTKEADARRKPNTIVGDILTLDGKPIPNVARYQLYVGGATIAGERTHLDLEVDENGYFEQRLPDGLYKVYASCIVNYAGHRVPVDLISLDGKPMGVNQPADKGIVKEFRLVMNGLKPGEAPDGVNAWFGGVLSLRDGSPDIEKNLHTRFPNAKVRITFTPTGPLVDGSTIQPFSVEGDVHSMNFGSARFQRIPLGVYRLSAMLVTADGRSKPLGIARGWGGPYSGTYELFWQSSEGDTTNRAEQEIFLRD